MPIEIDGTEYLFTIYDGSQLVPYDMVKGDGTPIAEHISDFQVSITGTNSPIVAGESLQVDFSVQNDGTIEDTQNVRLFDPGGNHVDTSSHTLPPGGSATGTLLWITDESNAGDNQTVEVTTEDDNATTTVTVQEPAFFDVTAVDPNDPITAGDTLWVDYTVENTGGVQDSQSIDFYADGNLEEGVFSQTIDAGGVHNGTFQWDTDESDDGTRIVEVTTDDDSYSTFVDIESAVDLIEDFSHDNLTGRYNNSMPNSSITTARSYYDSGRSLRVPNSSDGGFASAYTSQFSDLVTTGNSYRFPYYLESDGSGQRIRTYIGTDGERMQSGGGYGAELTGGDFRVSAWSSSGTQIESDTTSVGSVPYYQWDYVEFSYANSSDGGSGTVEARLITNGSVTATGRVDTVVTDQYGWTWREEWGYDTIYYGGIEQL